VVAVPGSGTSIARIGRWYGGADFAAANVPREDV
jgi:hypothetical protein